MFTIIIKQEEISEKGGGGGEVTPNKYTCSGTQNQTFLYYT